MSDARTLYTRHKYLFFLFYFMLACSAQNETRSSGPATDQPNVAKKKSRKGKDCLKLVNGTKTGDFPSVYQIASINLKTNAVGGCTGAFVSDNTMITAAHCIPCDPKALPIRLMGNGDTISYTLSREDLESKPIAQEVFMSDQGYCDGKALMPWRPDVAILLFPKGTVKKYASLAKERLAEGTPVTLVGYGMTDKTMLSNPEPQNTKRYGYNQLITRPSTVAPPQPEAYEIIGRGKTSASGASGVVATDTMGVHGDSGSPLFKRNSDTIIGILSGGTTADQRYAAYQKNGGADLVNFYTDANSQTVKNLVSKAIAAGGKFTYEGDPRPADPTQPLSNQPDTTETSGDETVAASDPNKVKGGKSSKHGSKQKDLNDEACEVQDNADQI